METAASIFKVSVYVLLVCVYHMLSLITYSNGYNIQTYIQARIELVIGLSIR